MTSQYKIDKTHYSTMSYRYYSYNKVKYEIAITGSIPNNTLRRWQLVVNFLNARVHVRVFLTRRDTGLTVPAGIGWKLPTISGSYEVYQSAAGEIAETNFHYENNGAQFIANFFISNTTGSSVNLIDQQLDMWLEVYEAPISWF